MATAQPIPGIPQPVSPIVRRVLAANGGPFTGWGTGSFIVGRGTVAVIDPGPDDDAHLAALIAATAGETVSHVVVTHTHRDHSPLARRLADRTGAMIAGCAPLAVIDDGPRADSAFDDSYAPDRVLVEGDTVTGPGWTLATIATPGHTSNHLAFALPEERALFPGDHVMGWATTVVSPPDGDMTAYLASLETLLARDDTVYHPTHGPSIADPQRLVRRLLVHRRQREAAIIRLLGRGPAPPDALVPRMYAGVDRRLYPAAARSVLAHLIDLERRALVTRDGPAWRLA